MAAAAEHHHETLRVPASWWLLGAAFVLAVWWACYVATPAWLAGLAALVAFTVVSAALWAFGSAQVLTSDDGVHAGRAHLPWRYVGESVALDAAVTRRQQGVEADARAFLLMRSYCPASVKIMVDDPDDPAPYWLISTRHSERLVTSLNRHRVSG